MEVYSSKQTPLQVDASIASNLDNSKVCLCNTNRGLSHKNSLPRCEETLNSKVVSKEETHETAKQSLR